MLHRKELVEPSKRLLTSKGYTIVEGEKSKFTEFFAEKDGKKYSVSMVRSRNNTKIDAVDVMTRWVSANMHKNPVILCSENPINEDIKVQFPELTFFSINE